MSWRFAQCDIYSYGVILWEIITGATATRGRLYEPEVRLPCCQIQT